MNLFNYKELEAIIETLATKDTQSSKTEKFYEKTDGQFENLKEKKKF